MKDKNMGNLNITLFSRTVDGKYFNHIFCIHILREALMVSEANFTHNALRRKIL